MAKIPRGPSLKLLLNDLLLAQQRADRLGLTIAASLIAMAMINVGSTPAGLDEDPVYLNDNQITAPSSKD